MSTLIEIEQAANRLNAAEREQLLFALAKGLRDEGKLPAPRKFSPAEMAGWMDEDEADFKALKGGA